MKCLILCFLPLIFACTANEQEQEKNKAVSIVVEELDSPTEASLRGITVLDSNCIWLSGASGSILRTLDGGENWQLLAPPDQDSLDFRDVHAFSKSSALIVSAGFPARVYLTENAGETWQLVYENLDSNAFMNSVHFKDSANGLIVGDVLNGYHLLLETNNGGRRWQRIDSSKLAKPLDVEHAFAASGSCITVNSDAQYVVAFGGEKNRVLIQEGDKWTVTELPFSDSAASSGLYSIASGGGILMTAGGDYSREDLQWPAIYSNNDGVNWESTGNQYNGYRSVVAYSPSMKKWLAAGTNGIDLLNSDKEEWAKVSDRPINTLQFDTFANQAWAAGPNGNIYRIIFKR
jgi:photosystem II stability/assembly factor-like uncharacterized protein